MPPPTTHERQKICFQQATGSVKKLTTSVPLETLTMGVTNSRRKPSQRRSPGNQCLGHDGIMKNIYNINLIIYIYI